MKKTTKDSKRYIETLKQRQIAYEKQIQMMRSLSQNYYQSLDLSSSTANQEASSSSNKI